MRYNTIQLSVLTKREQEILELISLQFETKQIAEKLFISKRTVETHRKNILQKTGAINFYGLVRKAVESNIFNVSNFSV